MLRLRPSSRTTYARSDRNSPHRLAGRLRGEVQARRKRNHPILGSPDASHSIAIRSAFARALIPIALLSNALIVDDGAADGLAGLLGEAIDQVDSAPATLGILPAGTTQLASNHTAMLRLPAQCANPDKQRFLIATSLAGKQPITAMLIGGSDSDKMTALRCARKCCPMLVIKNSGVMSDALLAARDSVDGGGKVADIADPDTGRSSTAARCGLSISPLTLHLETAASWPDSKARRDPYGCVDAL